MTPRGEEGAATVLVLAMVGVLTFVTVGLAAGAGLVRAQREAQSAADLAALAAASAHLKGDDGCAAAASVAAANGARLAACDPGADDVRISVEVAGPRWVGRRVAVRAEARAGPAHSACGAPCNSTSSRATAPPLSRGLFWLPHLGDCTQAGQPSAHPQSRIRSRVTPSQR